MQKRRFGAVAAVLPALLATWTGCSSSAPVVFETGSEEELALAQDISLRAIEDEVAATELNVDVHRDLRVSRVFVDELSMAHTRVQQMHRGIPVWGGEAIVHLNRDGSRFAVTNGLRPHVDQELDVSPRLRPAAAVNIALTGLCAECMTAPPKTELWVVHHDERDHLAYRVSMERLDGSEQTSMPVVFLDAHTGEELFRYDNLQTGTGTSLYSGSVSVNTYIKTGTTTYNMEDIGRKLGTFDMTNTTTSVYRMTDTNDVWDSAVQKAAVDAHYGAAKVYDYFKNVHGRNGIDGSGGPAAYTSADGVTGLIGSRVHYGMNYGNAFWDGSKMTYGDGDGTTFAPLVSLDIAAHEMTHGITERTAGLIYNGESGALNESMSDVFGALVERYANGESANTWRIGEAVYTPATSGDALRYMDDPHAASNNGFTANDDPDHYSERYTGTGDNGGVHINSGIPNKVFYLLAKGGTHHLGGSMSGIGADKAGLIWYKALTTYMTSSTNFAAARTATLNAATALYGTGSLEYVAVENAWGLCGVGSVSGGGNPPPPPPPSGELVVNGTFESSSSPWVLSGAGALYTNNGNYPYAGTGYAYFGGANSLSGQTYQQISIPSTATTANLSFYLSVTSSETTTTTQYDRFFVEVRNTAGTLLTTLATFSNLNKSSTGAYVLRGNYNMLAYKGQTVRIQFRATTDSTSPTTFRVDNVSVK